jgi:hypothetical protein
MTIPNPIVEFIDGIYVVRDDLIPGGTKRSFADQLIYPHAEVVYSSPVYGGAQIAIAHAAREQGARATIFCAKRKKPHPRTIEAFNAGAKIVQIPSGYLSNVKAKATNYCKQTGAYMLPFGLETETAFSAIASRAKLIQQEIGDIDQVWSVGGSGVLCRGLQRGIIAKSFHVVQIGRQLKPTDVKAAKIYVHPLDFSVDAKIKPPFPSCSNYDAKAWEFVKRYATGRTLFWNVMR